MGRYGAGLTFLRPFWSFRAIRESVLGTNHPSTAISYNQIAAVCQAKGDLDTALQHTLAALAIQERLAGADDKLAVSYNRLSHIHKLNGNHDHALRYHLDAVALATEPGAGAGGGGGGGGRGGGGRGIRKRRGSLQSAGPGLGLLGDEAGQAALDRTLKYVAFPLVSRLLPACFPSDFCHLFGVVHAVLARVTREA